MREPNGARTTYELDNGKYGTCLTQNVMNITIVNLDLPPHRPGGD